MVYYKKYHCKVCFHGICAKCSTYVDSLDPRKTETVCVKCAGSGVTNTKNNSENDEKTEAKKKKVQEIQEKIDKKQQKKKVYLEKFKTEEKLFEDSQIEISIGHFRKDKQDLIEKSNKLKKELEYICEHINEKESIYFESETYVMEERYNLDIKKQKVSEVYELLSNKQNEHIQLLKELESLSPHINGKNKSQKQIAREENLRLSLEKLMKEEKNIIEENEKIVEELNTTESELYAKDAALKKAHDQLKIIPEQGDIEEDGLKQLNFNLEEQKKLIKQLKSEIAASRSNQEQITDNKCNCEVI